MMRIGIVGIMALLLLAGPLYARGVGKVAPAQPIVPLQDLFTQDDYPTASLAKGESGAVAFTYTVDPDGIVRTCKIASSSGYPELDKVTCELLIARARYTPARDASGKAIVSTFTRRVVWSLPKDGGYDRPLPPPVSLLVHINLDINGGFASCTVGDLPAQSSQQESVCNEVEEKIVRGMSTESLKLYSTIIFQGRSTLDGIAMPPPLSMENYPEQRTLSREATYFAADGAVYACYDDNPVLLAAGTDPCGGWGKKVGTYDLSDKTKPGRTYRVTALLAFVRRHVPPAQ